MKAGLVPLIPLLLGAMAPLAAAAEPPGADPLLAELVGITREISEAIRLGDQAALDRHLLADMVLVNRDGRTYDRQEFLADLVPPRPGYDLRFAVLEPKLVRAGDAAVLTFLLDEHLLIYGHDMSTQFRVNLVFGRGDGGWKVAFYEYFEKPVDPAPVPLDPATYDELAGTYEIAPGRWVTRIWREGSHLLSRRDQGAVRELTPVGPDRFFFPGSESEVLFLRDASGCVEGMVLRRNWKDLPYRRIG